MVRIYGALVACLLAGQPAFAQFTPPPVLNPIPAPLPPPAPPPTINGPLGQSPPPGERRQNRAPHVDGSPAGDVDMTPRDAGRGGGAPP